MKLLALIFVLILPILTSGKVLKARAYLFKAVSSVTTSNLQTIGTIDFWLDGNNKVFINGSISNVLPPNNKHGFHVHQYGDLDNNCMAAGSHFNPHNETHGGPNSTDRHVGDLGNINVDGNGVATVSAEDPQVALSGVNSVIGRALVVHQNTDDLGLGNNTDSLTTGNAGPRIACGVIGLVSEDSTNSAASLKILSSIYVFLFAFLLWSF